MARKKRYNKGLRNIILFFLVVSATIVFIVWFKNAFKPLPPLLPPESQEITTMRSSPENAYFILAEAYKLIPVTPRPDPTQVMQFEAQRAPDRMGVILDIWAPDDNPELIAYVEQCAPAVAKAREALDAPYFLWPDFAQMEQKPLSYSTLLPMVHAYALLEVREHPESSTGLKILVDGLRLCRMIGSDGWVQTFSRVRYFEGHMFESLHEAIVLTQSNDALYETLDILLKMGQSPITMRPNVEFEWRNGNAAVLDIAWHKLPPLKYFFVQILGVGDRSCPRAVGKFIAGHREELLDVMAKPYPEIQTWLKSNQSSLHKAQLSTWGFEDLSAGCAGSNTWCGGAQIIIALELYKRANYHYPENLNELVPTHLTNVPAEAFSGAAFHYERHDDDYKLECLINPGDTLLIHEPKTVAATGGPDEGGVID